MDPVTLIALLEWAVPAAIKAGVDIATYFAMRAQNKGEPLTPEQIKALADIARANVEKM